MTPSWVLTHKSSSTVKYYNQILNYKDVHLSVIYSAEKYGHDIVIITIKINKIKIRFLRNS